MSEGEVRKTMLILFVCEKRRTRQRPKYQSDLVRAIDAVVGERMIAETVGIEEMKARGIKVELSISRILSSELLQKCNHLS